MASHYRHEWKHVLNYGNYLVLRQRLKAVMEKEFYHEFLGYLQIKLSGKRDQRQPA